MPEVVSMKRCARLLTCLGLAFAACEPDRAVEVGALSVTPGQLAFGSVDVGLSRRIRVSVLNPSGSAVAVPAIKIASDPNGELQMGDLLTTDCSDRPRAPSQTLAPGECARFTATWSPNGAHKALGSVELDPSNSNDPIVLPVSGLGLSTVFPLLRICALDDTGLLVDSACSDLAADPPAIPTVDFGNGSLTSSSTRIVRLFNNGQAPLVFAPGPTLPLTTPVQLQLAGSIPGDQIAPGDSADLTLSAAPTELGTLTGELDLATNDPRDPFVAVPLTIATTGIAICVQPAVELAFGLTLIGTSPAQSFSLMNCGMDDVSVDSDFFSPVAPTTSQFALTSGASIALGSILHPADELSSSVTYTPTLAESDLGALNVRFTNRYGAYNSRVGLSGSAVTTFCGTAMEPVPVANIAASYSSSAGGPFLPFDPNATPSPIVPLDYVRFSGASSTGANPPAYTWKLVSQPSGSTTVLLGSGDTVQMQTLVAGDYVVELEDADASACTGSTQTTIHVVPTGDVHIELTWAEGCGDVDLHYLAPESVLCGTFDTAYYNTNPDWGCLTRGCGHEEDPGGSYPDNTRSDDATLDHDDQWGFGPENITQALPFDSPADAPYQIWVYYFSPVPDGGGGDGRCDATHPTIDIYIGGILTNSLTLSSGLQPFQAWHAADIAVANQGTNIDAIARDTAASSGDVCRNAGRRNPAQREKDRLGNP